MSIAGTIRNARQLNFAGAQPGASAVVHKAVKTLEEEHALRMNLQRENNRVRRIVTQMEDNAVAVRKDAEQVKEIHPDLFDAFIHEAQRLEAFSAAIRTALTPEGHKS